MKVAMEATKKNATEAVNKIMDKDQKENKQKLV